MTRIILVRHGQSTANLKHIFAGHKDVELTPTGHAQARKTAEYIIKNYKIDAIYSSDLSRAYDTALYIAEDLGMPVMTRQNLREINAGRWQGMMYGDILNTYHDAYSVWQQDIGNSHCTDGESVKQLEERVYTEMEKIVQENPDKTIVIVTHATPIRVLQCKWSRDTLNEMKYIPWVPNSSVTVVNVENNQYTIEVWGKDNYLSDLRSGFPADV